MINIGIGVGWAKALYSVANNVIANFKARVLSYPNSIFEAGPCLDATLEELNAIGLLDNASLVITPNAYNESKLYSVVPNTTLGDMDVVRATTATRVNSAGLIEVVPRNLLTYSEQFENIIWQKVGAAVTANSIAAPNGTITADKIVLNTSSYIVQSIPTSTTASCYVKGTAGEIIRFGIGSSVGNGSLFTFNGDWQRITHTNATPENNIFFSTFFGLPIVEFFVWGAQAENFPTATEYFPTTTRLNIPRIDYTNGSCPSILVEPQRTNLLTYSNDFTNTAWVKLNCSITANNTISPDGNNNASKLTCTVAGNFLYNAITAANATYTFSCFVKYFDTNSVNISLTDFATGSSFGVFNFTTKTFTSVVNGGSWTNTTTNVITLANGWFKISITSTKNAGSNVSSRIDSFAVGTSVYIYGAQLELGSYATSYIPTVASTVTRNADVISKTGISSLIGQTEGTMFCDVNLNSRANYTYFAIAPNIVSASTYIGIFVTSSIIGFEVIISGVVQSGINFSNSSTGRFKIAAAYKNNDFAFYINGNLIGIDTLGNIPACSELGLNAFSQAQTLNYNSAQLYKTRLTNTELQSLTTL